MNNKEEYVGKWVVIYNNYATQSRPIGSIYCVFIVEETEKLVYGISTEDLNYTGSRLKFYKKHIKRVVSSKEDAYRILNKQRVLKKEFQERVLKLEAHFRDLLNSTAKYS